jgi:hypothetical protein
VRNAHAQRDGAQAELRRGREETNSLKMSAHSPKVGDVKVTKARLREGVATNRQSTAQPRRAEEDTEFKEMLSKASFLNIRQKKKLAALRSGQAGNTTASPATHGLTKQVKGASVGVVRIAHPGSDQDEWRCRISSCSNKNYHRLRECSAFLGMTVGARAGLVLRKGLCRACLTIGHGTSGKRCIFAGSNNELCKLGRCRGIHHALLHSDPEERQEAVEEPPDLPPEPMATMVTSAMIRSNISEDAPVQLITQWIKTKGGPPCLTFWDSGSQVTLTTHSMAEELGLRPIGGPPLRLNSLGSGPGVWSTVRYKIPLVDVGGQVVELTAYGLDQITTNVEAVNPDSMQAMFPEVPSGKLEGASGRVSLLVGQDNLKFFPVENRRNSDAALHRNRFGTGWVASGKPSDEPVASQRRKKSPARPKAEKPLEVTTLAVTTASREGGIFLPLDFLSAEALLLGMQGMQIPGGLNLLQRKPRISGDLGGAEHQRGNGQMDGRLSLLHSPHRPEGQL